MKREKILLPVDASNVKYPWLWLGTWSMGGEGFGNHDERESLRVLHSAAEHNIRHFDTAGLYAHGKSERLLCKLIKTDRHEFFISSKGGLVWNGNKVEHQASAVELRKQLYESLERLSTDYIDLYQLHWPDPHVPVTESISALKSLKDEGLIRFWGVGNLDEQQIKNSLSNEKNIPHQVHFNPVHSDYVSLSAGKDKCINCIVSPLEQGLLGSGKSSLGKDGIGKKDIRNRNPYFSSGKVLNWNHTLDELFARFSISKIPSVLMWICAQPHVHAVIPGPRTIKQLNEICDFISEVGEQNLLSDESMNSVLSEDKVRASIPENLWNHLSQGI